MNLNQPIPKEIITNNNLVIIKPKNESLIYLDCYFSCDSQYNHWNQIKDNPLPGSSPHIIARKTVVEKLLEAQKLLPKGYHFKIYDAYRPIIIQQKLWDFYYQKNKKENPGLVKKDLLNLTQKYVSYPSYNILQPSLHNTGGAIDLTIIDNNGFELDMGTIFDSFDEKSNTDYFENTSSTDIKVNRRILYNVMKAVGFVNLPSEWWHYDYGDSIWAQYNNVNPLYAGILAAHIKDSVPYNKQKELTNLDSLQHSYISNIIDNIEKCEKFTNYKL